MTSDNDFTVGEYALGLSTFAHLTDEDLTALIDSAERDRHAALARNTDTAPDFAPADRASIMTYGFLEGLSRSALQQTTMAIDPDAKSPTPRQLNAFMQDGCPQDVITKAGARLKAILSPTPDGEALGLRFIPGGLFTTFPRPDTDEMEIRHMLANEYLAVAVSTKKLNPLAPLVGAWLDSRPRPAQVSDRTTARILPARIAMAGAGDPRAGRLFAHAAYSVESHDGQLVLPGFQHDRQAPALPLALYDLGLGASTHNLSGPAPLALRLWVESILAVMQQDRHGDHPDALEIPLRQLLARLYPGGRTPRPNEYWPRLIAAVEALDNRDARVPWYDPGKKRSGLRRVVSVGDIPRGPKALDDIVRIVVDLPPGSEFGPQVPDSLPAWGAKSAVAYRTLLNLAYWWHNPGVTVRPIAKRTDRKGLLWAPSDRPQDYPDITDAELVETVFPTSKTDAFRILKARARKVMAELEAAGEIRINEGKIMPPRHHRSERTAALLQ